jgi:hypothetical protein
LFYNAVNDSFTCSECKYTLLAGTEEYKAIFFKIVDTEQPMKREPSPKKHDKHDLFANVIWPDDSLKSIEEQNESAMSDLSNPMLISVKMFLADIRPWVRQYREGAYVCSDFAQEVCNAAKDREMRCGYVTIGFEKSFVGHAIIAFETDYGLIFIEPQDGEQIYLSINKPYPIRLKGIPEDDNIILIEISWNDGTSTRID